MKAALVSPSLSRLAAGIFEVTRHLAIELHGRGHDIQALGLIDEFSALDAERWSPVQSHFFNFLGPAGFGYSPELSSYLEENTFDLLHLHALWMYTSIAGRNWSKATSRPYLVTPNGMLDPWAMKHARTKKMLAWHCYEHATLNQAACLQANTIKEALDIQSLGLTNPICVIPNGVTIPTRPTLSRIINERRTFLFLGRKHQKKGLRELIAGYALCRSRNRQTDSRLLIAGSDNDNHEKDLIQLVSSSGLTYSRDLSGSEDIIFLGEVYNEQKIALFGQTDVFVLPSLSEGQPMAALEAMAGATPVLLTPQCNLPEASTYNAALEVHPNPESIARGLEQYLSMSVDELRTMGDNGRKLVQDRFSWENVAGKIESVYEWLAGGGPPPDTIVT
jgi:glycosyltransferase involved in cell wall biosynthesis